MTTTLRRKLLWLIAGRATVVTLLLGSAILIQIIKPGAFPIDPFFFLIGLTYTLTAVYSVALKFTERHRWLVDLQLGCDAFLVSAVVMLTGGVTSYFSTLYTIPIIAASVIESRRGGMMVGVLSSVLYSAVVLVQYYSADLLPGLVERLLPPTHIALYTVGLNVFGFLGVAALSGYLAEGLRRADAQLQRASYQIADLQAFSRHIVDSLTSGLATTDRRGRILSFNRAAEAITGTPATLAVGSQASAVLQLPETFDWLFDGTEPQPAPRRLECPFTRGDGRQIELGISSGPFFTPSGETGSLFTFQDVTEARKQEREARVQQRLAAVGEMAAGIAHEIRNPLASMSGSIQILRQELPLTTEQAQLMDIVLRESERLNDTIRSFLAYARPQRQEQNRIDVRQIITDTARLLKNNADLSEAHEIIVSVPVTEAWYDADENQIRQIVWNLATNGLRAMPDGGRLRLTVGVEPADRMGAENRPEQSGRPSVQAAGRSPGARGDEGDSRTAAVVIIVEDEGVGIAAEDLDGVFQPFRGAFARGSGLGLSIVQRIVSDYGGEVHVTSQPGEGTAVTVRLPSAVAADLAGRTSVN